MPPREYTGCPVHADFDPLSTTFLADPFAVLASVPHDALVFYAPSIGYYVVARYADIEAVFLDHETYSAAVTQLPLVSLVPEAARILSAGGTAPRPSMVSLDPIEQQLRTVRGTKVSPYTGHAEAWIDRAESAAAAGTPEAQRAGQLAVEDEANFIDFKNSSMWIAKERVVIDRR